ncbi:MAG: phosphoribosyltransferase [Candidatus Competibacteraceae bacterium]|nr:phosphoribosyltransferase [Candidatus Competibacteraceae bacterium]
MQLPYENRVEAGRRLAERLQDYAGQDDLLVLALPRGGVPVAFEVAQSLQAPLDLMLVRKLGTPGQEELAMGAIASGGAQVLNEDLICHLAISATALERVAAQERKEMERRRQAYRGDRPEPQIGGRCVILVDDGIATGATMRVAVSALRQLKPAQVVVAVPVAPPDTVELLSREADKVVCPATPEPFFGVGRWYADFSQTDDQEVRRLLKAAWSPSS